jgi:DNA-directed RNA polymerase subunit L
MALKVSNIEHNSGITTFSVENINVSLVNALRRVILSDIPCVVFRSAPHDKSLVDIAENTTRLNNEILKHRMSCIPIHIRDLSIPLDNYVVEVNMENDTNEVVHITTKDFKIKNVETDKYLTDKEVARIFPPNEITGDHIIFARLRPRISDEIPGEKLALSAKMVVSTAKEDGAFNVASTCSYSMTPDRIKQQQVWTEKEKEMKSNGVDEADIQFAKADWLVHDGKRVYKDNAFDFVLESVGVFDNASLVHTACDIMVKKLEKLVEESDAQTLEIKESETLMTAFDIVLENEDYTLGKCVEYGFHKLFYHDQEVFDFVGFRKHHPHDSYSVVRLSFKDNTTEKTALYAYVKEVSEYLVTQFEELKKQV